MDGPKMESKGGIEVGGIKIQGDMSGQIAIGNHNTLTQSTKTTGTQITVADLQELHGLIEELKVQAARSASPELQDPALAKAAELEQAITASEPDLGAMERVRDWFANHLPQLAGTVGALVVHPIVGKIVEAAGEAAALEFKRRFGIQ